MGTGQEKSSEDLVIFLIPDWGVPEGPCEPAGQWQGAVSGLQAGVNACAQHTESLHNGCGANDAPGDKNSLAPEHGTVCRHQWKNGNIQDTKVSSLDLHTHTDFRWDHNS